MIKVHLDTDIGGDIDDLCALAMLLEWPGVEISGITTVADEGGRRAGYARYALGLDGRSRHPRGSGGGCRRSPLPLAAHLSFRKRLLARTRVARSEARFAGRGTGTLEVQPRSGSHRHRHRAGHQPGALGSEIPWLAERSKAVPDGRVHRSKPSRVSPTGQ